MVAEQLIPRGITDTRVLEVFHRVPRDRFLPPEHRDRAYSDHPLPIGSGQTISQPYMVALMTQSLTLTETDRVLEIGTGSGYQTAVLAELAGKVYSIERVPDLASRARAILAELGYATIHFKTADGTLGWETAAPFDAMVVTAGSPDIPASLLAQLNEGGRLVIPLGHGTTQMLTLVEKAKGRTRARELCQCVFVPLIGEGGWQSLA